MEIIIYATHRGSARDTPEQTYYSLEKPELACSGFINVSEYALPAGYSVHCGFNGTRILNAGRKICQLGGGRRPVLIDPDIIDQQAPVPLKKTRDITLRAVMERLLEEEGYVNHYT